LKTWDWEIVRFDPAKSLSRYHKHAVEEYETDHGPADYALVVGGRMLVSLARSNARNSGSSPNRVGRESPVVALKPLDSQGFVLLIGLRNPA